MKLPNRLTLLRIALAPVFLILLVRRSQSYGTIRPYVIAALAVLIVAIVSDGLDGYFARKWGQTSKLGIFLDPIADKLLVIPPLIWLAYVRAVSPWVVVVIVARELIVSALRLLAAGEGIALPAGLLGKAKTVAEYAFLIVVTYTFGNNASLILSWICAALAALSAVEYFHANRALLIRLFRSENKLDERSENRSDERSNERVSQ
ncbi:CDP-diacylglycerol--glycerol-3-phosphate 3-phosphatidyltransferase [Clostridia bacterium]|nr:CDP-diacylglycerol--glycerol-3-phosphate 3-phosphatidyltransferase [Clostridia bacterium]